MLAAQRLWVQFPGNTYKSLWIKASAKCINVNVITQTFSQLCECVCMCACVRARVSLCVCVCCVSVCV